MSKHDHQITAVAFDMDGLIFDTETLSKKAFALTAIDFGIVVEEDYYKRFIGNSQPVCDQLMFDKFGRDFDAAGFRMNWWNYVGEIFDAEGVEFKPGFHAVFENLKSNKVPVALVTTSSHKTVLRNFKGWDYPLRFDTLITCDRGLPAKPAPDKYLTAASELEVDEGQMIVLEDSNTGMQAAINANCKAIMVPDLVSPTEQIRKSAYKIFSTLDGVNEWFYQQGLL